MSSPVLNEKTFKNFAGSLSEPMTIQGVVNKSLFLLSLLLVTAFAVWFTYNPETGVSSSVMLLGCLGGLVVSFIIIFNKQVSPILSPIYAILEGLAIGGLSLIFELKFPGIVLNATGLTFGVTLIMFLLYKNRIVRVTDSFARAVVSAIGAICLVYIVDIILMFFGMQVPLLHEGGIWGILISLVIVGVAALSLMLDFDLIEKGVTRGAPKYMEWYGAFSLMVTLVWLYLEILKYLNKLKK